MQVWRVPNEVRNDFGNLVEVEDNPARIFQQSQIVYSPNGGLAQFYIRSIGQTWQQPPTNQDIQRVASLLYREAIGHDKTILDAQLQQDYSQTRVLGDFSLTGAFGDIAAPAIFVRINDAPEGNNFMTDYRWLKGLKPNPNDPDDFTNLDLASIGDFISAREATLPDFNWPEFEARLAEMNHKNPTGSRSGDIVTIMDARNGFLAVNIESDIFRGWHGGPEIGESHVPLMFAMPGNLFTNESGSLVATPGSLTTGFNNGKSDLALSQGAQLRNWHMGPILTEIIKGHRDD